MICFDTGHQRIERCMLGSMGLKRFDQVNVYFDNFMMQKFPSELYY